MPPRFLLQPSLLEALLPYLALLLWVGPLLLFRSGQQSLMAHDEGIYAAQARAILELNNWLAPQWGGAFSYDRAIGIQWLIALCYQLFGVSEGSARLPSTLAFTATVLLTYAIGCRCLPRPVAWLGAAILAVTPISLQYGRLATQDAVLVAVELLGIWALLKAEAGDRSRPWALLAGATLGLGFLIKSFMILPVAAALLPYLVWEHPRHRHLTNPWLYGGLGLGLAPVALWLGLSVAAYGWVPFEQMFGKLFHLKQQTYQGAGPFYYFWNIPVNAFPWAFFAVVGLGVTWCNRNFHRLLATRHAFLLLVGYPLTLWVELNLFGTKTRYYPLQLLPFVALLAAIALNWLVSLYIRRDRSRQWVLETLTYGFGGLALLLVIAGLGIVTQFIPLHIPSADAEEVYRHGLIGLTLGLGWLLLPLVWLARPRWGDLLPSAQRWLAAWLIGPWLGLAMLGLTGQWGDYNPDLKTFLQQSDVKMVLQSRVVNFVVQEDLLDQQGRKTYLLLNFYTPRLGTELSQLSSLQSGEYAWIAPGLPLAQAYFPGSPDQGYQVIGTIRGWQLGQAPNREQTALAIEE